MRILMIGCLAAGLAACAADPPPPAAPPAPPPAAAAITNTATITARVESIDMAKRTVLLRGEDGQLTTVIVGPEIRNLAQVRAGDLVVVEMEEALMVAAARPGDGAGPVSTAGAAGRAAPGQRPGAMAGEAVRVRVRIDSVDAAAGKVAFTGPRGLRRTVTVRDPAMLDFLRGLRRGDQVDVVYAEAVALRVEPMRR